MKYIIILVSYLFFHSAWVDDAQGAPQHALKTKRSATNEAPPKRNECEDHPDVLQHVGVDVDKTKLCEFDYHPEECENLLNQFTIIPSVRLATGQPSTFEQLYECAQACLASTECKSFSYRAVDMLCGRHIVNAGLVGNLTDEDPRFNYYKVTAFSKDCSNSLQCCDGECIDASSRCDKRVDCSNGEDENNCQEEEHQNDAVQFLPSAPELQHPIEPVHALTKRMAAVSEQNLVKRDAPGPDCGNLYQCSDFTCINSTQVCNKKEDCPTGEDEKDCPEGDYQIRLAGSDKYNEGRIEIHWGGRWGQVCDDKLEVKESNIACIEMGFPLGSVQITDKSNSYVDDLPVEEVFYQMDDVVCEGDETSFQNCSFSGYTWSNCNPDEVVGTVCRLPEGKCPEAGQFKCHKSEECISTASVCDGKPDCADKSDEGSQLCLHNPVKPGALGPDCGNFFQCSDFTCINSTQVCNKKEDCPTGEDEKDCPEGDYQIRLAGSDKYNEGRIEIHWGGRWGQVCDDKLEVKESNIACIEMGFPLGSVQITDKSNSYVDDLPVEEVFYQMDDVVCEGDETSFQNCSFSGYTWSNCNPDEVVGTICRLPEGKCPEAGQFKCHKSEECISTASVCDRRPDCADKSDEGSQLCLHNPVTPGALGPDCGNFFQCSDYTCINTTQVCNKKEDCPTGEDEKDCPEGDYQIRLAGSDKYNEGRIEIHWGGRWGQVCDDKLEVKESNIACIEMGFPLGSVQITDNSNSYVDDLPVEEVFYQMDDVVCEGDETSFQNCSFSGYTWSNCNPNEVVGTVCRLPEEKCPDAGQFKCHKSEECIPTVSVCDGKPDCADNSDEGSQLCLHGRNQEGNLQNPDALGPDCTNMFQCADYKCINVSQVCNKKEDCATGEDEKDCPEGDYQIRLAGSHEFNEGRIEIHWGGRWGQVCDDKLEVKESNIACKEMGFPLGSVKITDNSNEYVDDLPVEEVFYQMDDVVCEGDETSFQNCSFSGYTKHDCTPTEVVGTVCKLPEEKCPNGDQFKCHKSEECIPTAKVCDGNADCADKSDEGSQLCQDSPLKLRLVNGSSEYEGRVEIRHLGIWGTICDDMFVDFPAQAVCDYFGFHGPAHARRYGYFGQGTGPIWLDRFDCYGDEESFLDCKNFLWGVHNCHHSEDAGVSCSAA